MCKRTNVWAIANHLLAGDPMEPYSDDLIAQLGTLDVGQPVPEGWRVLTGNPRKSLVARIAYRYEIEDEIENEE